jgi:hypothetical protein
MCLVGPSVNLFQVLQLKRQLPEHVTDHEGAGRIVDSASSCAMPSAPYWRESGLKRALIRLFAICLEVWKEEEYRQRPREAER